MEFVNGVLVEDLKGQTELVAVTGTQLLTGGSVANIFTITGGPILVLALVGQFIAAVSADACNMKLVMDPTTGADTDMCTVVDIVSAAAGSWVYLDGTIGNAAVIAVPASALPLGIGMDIPLVLPPGTIDMNLANSDPTTGTIVWHMRYKPLSTGVVVTPKG